MLVTSSLVDKVALHSSSSFVRTLIRKRVEYSGSIVTQSSTKDVFLFLIVAVHFLELPSLDLSFYSTLRFRSPVIVGTNQAICHVIGQYLEVVVERMNKVLQKGDKKPRTEGEDRLESESGKNSDDVLLLYGVSGAGKTRSIERLLNQNWGHYLLPGNLDLTTQRSLENLYDPRREGYSKDSCLLWKLVKSVRNVVPGIDIHPNSITKWSRCLILSRHLILDKFLEAADKLTGSQNPANWLRFQKSCSTFDPFETLFRLLLLIHYVTGIGLVIHSNFETRFKMPRLNELLSKETVYYCLDEAQCYLDTLELVRIHGPAAIQNSFQLTYMEILSLSRSLRPDCQSRFIVSETSLNLENTISAVESTRQYAIVEQILGFDLRGLITPTKCTKFTKFPHLTSDKQLTDLIKERGLLQQVEAHKQVVMKHGVPLRGRYLWSALYVDRLEAHLKENRRLDEDTIRTAATETIDIAKNDLKERLTRLKAQNYDKILQELCWIVIQSDLLDMPTKFEKDRDDQLISEAFAVVETQKDGLVGTLKERLAMEAATEWFREKDWEMYSGKIREYLRFATNDASSFGKAAEWFLALVRNYS